MENQHQKISGYRDLSQDEINAMNGAKHLEVRAVAKPERKVSQYLPFEPAT